VASEVVERSIAGRVEYWAWLGRAVDLPLNGQEVLKLCHAGANHPLSCLLGSVDTLAGRKRVNVYLEGQPSPHYRPHPGKPGFLERIEASGKRTVGRFVNRELRAARSLAKATSASK
jgi:hypothetical protein